MIGVTPTEPTTAAGGLTGSEAVEAAWLRGAAGPAGTTAAVTTPVSDGGFATSLSGALTNIQSLQSNADALAVKAATGSLDDVHAYTIAASQAKLATQLTVAIRNRAVEAFNEIMRMPA